VFKKLRVITRNYEPELLRVSRNYDAEVRENHEITHFRTISTKKTTFFNENFANFYEFYNNSYPPPPHLQTMIQRT
jgi:hypothetical protein